MESSTRTLIRDYGWTVLAAVIGALLIRFFVIEAYRIPTLAMRPTLESGDTVFVAKFPFGVALSGGSNFERGDVILYAPPDENKRDYIKRIIALPGETVQITGGKILIDGAALVTDLPAKQSCGTETLPGGKSHPSCWEPPAIGNFEPVRVPDHSYFVLGDLRSGTQIDTDNQGKAWGVIPQSSLKGRVLWVWLSIDPGQGMSTGGFPKMRIDRMFRRVK